MNHISSPFMAAGQPLFQGWKERRARRAREKAIQQGLNRSQYLQKGNRKIYGPSTASDIIDFVPIAGDVVTLAFNLYQQRQARSMGVGKGRRRLMLGITGTDFLLGLYLVSKGVDWVMVSSIFNQMLVKGGVTKKELEEALKKLQK